MEILDTIMHLLNREDLARLSRVSTSLCSIAQPVLFESVDVRFGLHAAKLVRARGPLLAPSTAALLASHTRSLVLGENTSAKSIVNAIRPHLLAILAACNKKHLRNLEILFCPLDKIDITWYIQLVSAIHGAGILCDRVFLADCQWSFLQMIIMEMGSHLREIHWHRGWVLDSDEGILDFDNHLWTPHLSNLTSLRLTNMRGDLIFDPVLQTLLETVAPHITSLTMTADDLIQEEANWTFGDSRFVQLAVLEYSNLPSGLYETLLEAAPNLQVLQLGNVTEMQSSLLATIPVGIRQLEVDWLDEEFDPLNAIVSHIKRLKHLDYLPALKYGNMFEEEGESLEEDEESPLTNAGRIALTRIALLEHFNRIGLPSTPEERDTLLRW